MKRISVIALISVFYLYLPEYSMGADFHVSTNGTNSPSCGTITSPCKTIYYTIVEKVDSGINVIKIATGSYSEEVFLQTPVNGLTVQGGWNEAFTSQVCSPTSTVLSSDSPNSTPLVVKPLDSDSINFAIKCMQISNVSGTLQPGIAILAQGTGSNIIFSMENCQVDSFSQGGVAMSALAGNAIQATLTDNYIHGNTDDLGAGLGFSSIGIMASINVKMHRNRIINNNSPGNGGGLYFYTKSQASINAELENNIIAENQAVFEGGGIGVFFDSSDPLSGSVDLTLTNNTITNNISTTGVGGGLSINSPSNTFSARLRNNIIWGNFDPFGTHGDDITMTMSPVSPDDGSGINVDYSIIGKVYVPPGKGNYIEGAHNLNSDPDLTSEYLLTGNSPAVDTGQCGFSSIVYKRIAPYDDIEGEDRPGYNQLVGCDIGADEYSSLLCFPIKNTQGKISTICF